MTRYDFRIDDHDSLILVYPLTVTAGDWCRRYLPEGMAQFGRAIVLDPEVWAIMSRDILKAGLTIGSATAIGEEVHHA